MTNVTPNEPATPESLEELCEAMIAQCEAFLAAVKKLGNFVARAKIGPDDKRTLFALADKLDALTEGLDEEFSRLDLVAEGSDG